MVAAGTTKPCLVSFAGAIDNSSLMPDFYKSETQKLLDKYYPIETSATMTEQEKVSQVLYKGSRRRNHCDVIE